MSVGDPSELGSRANSSARSCPGSGGRDGGGALGILLPVCGAPPVPPAAAPLQPSALDALRSPVGLAQHVPRGTVPLAHLPHAALHSSCSPSSVPSWWGHSCSRAPGGPRPPNHGAGGRWVPNGQLPSYPARRIHTRRQSKDLSERMLSRHSEM